MKVITFEQVLRIHSSLIKETGGIDGLRDEGLLISSLNAPFQTFDGEALFPSIRQKAAKLGFSLIKNHPFIDGYKRIGIHIMLIFLAVNGIELDYTQSELVQIGLSLANGTVDTTGLLTWIISHQT